MKGFDKIITKISDKKPEIFIAAGIVFGVAGVVAACKATLDVQDIVDEHKVAIDAVKKEYITTTVTEEGSTVTEIHNEPEYRRNITKVYGNTIVKVGRAYTPASALFALSAVFIIQEYKIIKELKAENIGLAAGWKATESILNRYREQMRIEKGEEEEARFYAGVESKDIEVVTVDDKGKEKKTKVKGAEVLNDEISNYAFIFDKSCGAYVGGDNNIDHNLYIASILQTSATENMASRGHIMYNEILDSFGKPRISEGWKLGCIHKNKGGRDDKVDFNIRKVYIFDEDTNEYVERILIDPQLDGKIDDLI